MASPSKLNLDVAVAALRSHQLSTLFTEILGWERPVANSQSQLSQSQLSQSQLSQSQLKSQPKNTPKRGTRAPKPPVSIQICQHLCQVIAHRDSVSVWQVSITSSSPFTTALRKSIYRQITRLSPQIHAGLCDAPTATSHDIAITEPLVIFVDEAKTRSLWCQSPQESALYVAGQPTALWQYRLYRFAQSTQGLFPELDLEQRDRCYANFAALVEGLCANIHGISNSIDRQAYACLTLQRLILVQSLQQKGLLAGDTWYLQTRFGTSLQQGNDRFFQTCLQPLYRSFALPAVERPLPIKNITGDVPFLGHLFDTHRIEQQYSDINIADQPFEEILGWLSEQMSTKGINPWMSSHVGYCLERYWAKNTLEISQPGLVRSLTQQSLDQWLIDQLTPDLQNFTTTDNSDGSLADGSLADGSSADDSFENNALNDILFNADAKLCRRLIQEILPELRILDPACGSGNFLTGLYQRLIEIFSNLTGYIQQTQSTQLKIWHSSLSEERDPEQANTLNTLQRRILKNNLYGVELAPEQAESARFQLLLHITSIARTTQNVEPLPDLTFNILTGNSLVGFITVDEERFDQVNTSGEDSILQGNLLQPLAADGYQTILAGKNLALEHYKSRNKMLAEARNVPEYARAALLRAEIAKLDMQAQQKLDALLLNYMSQQLGIQYKSTQLTDKPQRHPLTVEDIDILQPFHWGYHFSKIIKKGGFNIVVCAPPAGAFKPTVAEFLQTFQDLAKAKGLTEASFKTSKPALAKGNPDVAQAWLFYQNQYAYVADYFYRSEQYAHQNPTSNGKLVRNQLAKERLFVERCFDLTAADGIAALVLHNKLSTEVKAQTLVQYLKEHVQFQECRHRKTGRTYSGAVDAVGYIISLLKKPVK
ncbi:MAG: DNA methyltransferase [Cyanobacteria bacterium J06597_16]